MHVRNSGWLHFLLGLVLAVNGMAMARAAAPAAQDDPCRQHHAPAAMAVMPVHHDAAHGHVHAGDACGPDCGGLCCMPAALTLAVTVVARPPHAVPPPESAFTYAPSHNLPQPYRPPIA